MISPSNFNVGECVMCEKSYGLSRSSLFGEPESCTEEQRGCVLTYWYQGGLAKIKLPFKSKTPIRHLS